MRTRVRQNRRNDFGQRELARTRAVQGWSRRNPCLSATNEKGPRRGAFFICGVRERDANPKGSTKSHGQQFCAAFRQPAGRGTWMYRVPSLSHDCSQHRRLTAIDSGDANEGFFVR
jgi:hypothetical protein